jgi:hypothetical protein
MKLRLIGKLVTIRTATIYDRGVVVEDEADGFVLEDAVFVGDTGDFAKYCAMAKPQGVSEFKIVGSVFVARGAVCDIIVHK